MTFRVRNWKETSRPRVLEMLQQTAYPNSFHAHGPTKTFGRVLGATLQRVFNTSVSEVHEGLFLVAKLSQSLVAETFDSDFLDVSLYLRPLKLSVPPSPSQLPGHHSAHPGFICSSSAFN